MGSGVPSAAIGLGVNVGSKVGKESPGSAVGVAAPAERKQPEITREIAIMVRVNATNLEKPFEFLFIFTSLILQPRTFDIASLF